MAKKKRKIPQQPSSGKPSLAKWEASPYFAVVAFVVILIVLIVLFSGFVFSDCMLHGSDTLTAGFFFRSFYVDYVKQHFSVPLWNPYIWGGMPFVDAFHGDIFYPLSFLKFFGDLKRMLGWVLFWHIYLAGIFMYLTGRQFRLSKTAALFSAVCYMFAPYLVSLVAPGHDGKIFVTTLFPLTILFLDRGFERRPLLNFSLLGLVIGCIILSPHPQMSYFMLWALAFYTAYKLVLLFREKKSVFSVLKPASLAAYAVVIGLLLSAIQFYPGFYYTSHFSPRAETKTGWDWATSWSMHTEEAASLLVPEFVGTSSGKAKTYYWGKNAFKDNSEAVGTVAILFALIGVFFARRRHAYFFLGLGLFALSYALAGTTPLFKIYYYLIPKVRSMRAASMIIFLLSFSVALVAGMGLQHIRDVVEKRATLSRRFWHILLGFPGLLLVLALLFSVSGEGMLKTWCSLFYSSAGTTYVQRGVTRLDVAILNLPSIQSGFWLAFLFSSAAAISIWMYINRKVSSWILLAVVAIPMINEARFDTRFISTVDNATFRRQFGENQLIRLLKSKPGKFRVMNMLSDQDNTFPFHHIEIPTGYHGNQLRWYDNLVGDLDRKNRFKPGFLDLMGVRYLIAPANQKIPDGYLGSKPVVAEANLGSAVLYRNENALPRVFLTDRYRVIAERKQIYPVVLAQTDSLMKTAILEQEPSLEITPDSAMTDSAWIKDYEIDSVVVGVSCSANRLLVLTDVFYDAWKVSIDGVQAPLLRSYGALQAVALPKGTRQVVFRYDSQRYRTARLVTWLTSLYLACIIGLNLLSAARYRKETGAEDIQT